MSRRSPRTAQYEATNAWKEVSKAFRRRNPMCQVLDERGEACRYPAQLVHHLLSPDQRWDLRQDWSNLVSLCWQHHGPEAGDAGRYGYLPTVLHNGREFPHMRVNNDVVVPTGEQGRQFTAGTPSNKEMDALMKDVADLGDDW